MLVYFTSAMKQKKRVLHNICEILLSVVSLHAFYYLGLNHLKLLLHIFLGFFFLLQLFS